MTSTGTTTASCKVKSSIKDVPLIEERREQHVSAAVRVFKQKGFHAATIRDIGRAAGMTQGTIYNYVRSKDDILYLVCDRLVSQYQDETQRALEATQNSAQRIALITRAVAEVIYEHQDEILLIYQNTYLLDRRSLEVILTRIKGFVAILEDLISEAAAQERLKMCNPHYAAHFLTFLPTVIALRRWAVDRNTNKLAGSARVGTRYQDSPLTTLSTRRVTPA
jgi:AcrR family transcriptional regulator